MTAAGRTLDARSVLEERARRLARPTVADQIAATASGGAMTALVVRVADERIAIPLAQIVEVHRPHVVSPVPGAQAPVIGVVAWRGRVLTVLDLAHARPGAPPLGDEARVIVLGAERAALGIYADEVDDVQTVDLSTLTAPDDSQPDRAGVVRGVTPDALVVLDAVALLDRYTTSQ